MSTRVTPEDWPELRVVQEFVYHAPICDTVDHARQAIVLFATPDNRAFAACPSCRSAVEAAKRLAMEVVRRGV